MTISLNTPIQQSNISKWSILSPPDAAGRVTVRFTNPSQAQFLDVQCVLSDNAGQTVGVGVNPGPQSWNDKVINVGSVFPPGAVGAANSLTNALNAYRGAGTHAAGLKAMETQALVDGWVSSALLGT
jgi:hypothetical protein